jgi:crotonobetainyl-CoA:carnitine CoA-transferase CaiB-like acyl-CoA transferase
MSAGPLDGIRVIDLGTRIAAPFAATTLAELGADVIKVEDPGTGDMLRGLGPFAGGRSLFFGVEDRSRRNVTCNLRVSRGQVLFRRLAATADVLIENFRPGTLERWDIGPDRLPSTLVIARISVLGQHGPDADQPGLDLTAIARAGLLALTGHPDGPPVKSAVVVADHLTGAFAAEAVLAALIRRRRTGQGAVIDVPLHASILRTLESTIAACDRLGVERTRTGTRGPHAAPSGVYTAGDGRLVALVVESDDGYRAITTLVTHGDVGPEAADAAVAAWVGSRPSEQVITSLQGRGIPCSIVATARDLATDPALTARGDLVRVADPMSGPTLQPGPFPRLDADHRTAPSPAREVGADNEAVWIDEVGVRPEELAALRESQVV